MAVFAEAAERGDPRLRNLYFDVATNVTAQTTAEEAALIAKRIRQVGVQHVLYGSDLMPPGGSVAAGWGDLPHAAAVDASRDPHDRRQSSAIRPLVRTRVILCTDDDQEAHENRQ